MKNTSKILMICLALSLLGAPSLCAADTAALDERIRECNELFEEMSEMPDNAIPKDLISDCYGIAIFPSVLKGGFIVGARYGKGVILYHDRENHRWSAPAFFTIKGLSYGLQIGGQAIDLILVINNKRGMKSFLENSVTLGGDLAAAAGPVGRSAEASTDLSLKAGIFSYSRSKGLFAGISLEGSVIKTEEKSNEAYYGANITVDDILFKNKAPLSKAGKDLINILQSY